MEAPAFGPCRQGPQGSRFVLLAPGALVPKIFPWPLPCSRLLKLFRIRGELRRQRTPNISRLLQSPNRLPCQNRAARWAACRGIAKRIDEAQSFGRDTIEGRRLNRRIAISPSMGPGLIVGYAKENAWPFLSID